MEWSSQWKGSKRGVKKRCFRSGNEVCGCRKTEEEGLEELRIEKLTSPDSVEKDKSW